MTTVKALFLDRDGVIANLIGPDFLRGPRDQSELEYPKDIEKYMAILSEFFDYTFVVTNQPDIGRGILTTEQHNEVTIAIERKLPQITRTYTCPHTFEFNCACRKPKTGLLDQARSDFNISLADSLLVGDKWTDVAAGKTAGLPTVLLPNERSWEPTRDGSPPVNLKADFEIEGLAQLVEIVEAIPHGANRFLK